MSVQPAELSAGCRNTLPRKPRPPAELALLLARLGRISCENLLVCRLGQRRIDIIVFTTPPVHFLMNCPTSWLTSSRRYGICYLALSY